MTRPPGRPGATAPAMQLYEHADESAWCAAIAQAVLAMLGRAAPEARPEVWLVSGGSTPEPLYRTLAAAWPSRGPGAARLCLSLVDERWLAPGEPGRNEDLLRACWGVRCAPEIWPLVDWNAGLAASVARANARLQAAAPEGPGLVLLGMGEDGHTASLFPGSVDLDRALASPVAYRALDAHGCPGAVAWPWRITLTPAGWQRARRRLLLLRGDGKRKVFDQACREGDARRWPVCAAVAVGQAPLEVHWAP